MFCPSCGKEIVNESIACNFCGKSLREKPRKKIIGTTGIVGLIILTLLLWGIYEGTISTHNFQGQRTNPLGAIVESTHPIFNGERSVPAGAYAWIPFTVPSNARITGNLRASGGSGNDIRVTILNAVDFENWRNGHQASTYYNSGKVTAQQIQARLEPGSYCLVFDNTFSTFSEKRVLGTVNLHY